jgi:hypothetical protein
MDITIMLPLILGGEQTSYLIVLISLASLDLTILQYGLLIMTKRKIHWKATSWLMAYLSIKGSLTRIFASNHHFIFMIMME